MEDPQGDMKGDPQHDMTGGPEGGAMGGPQSHATEGPQGDRLGTPRVVPQGSLRGWAVRWVPQGGPQRQSGGVPTGRALTASPPHHTRPASVGGTQPARDVDGAGGDGDAGGDVVTGTPRFRGTPQVLLGRGEGGGAGTGAGHRLPWPEEPLHCRLQQGWCVGGSWGVSRGPGRGWVTEGVLGGSLGSGVGCDGSRGGGPRDLGSQRDAMGWGGGGSRVWRRMRWVIGEVQWGRWWVGVGGGGCLVEGPGSGGGSQV